MSHLNEALCRQKLLEVKKELSSCCGTICNRTVAMKTLDEAINLLSPYETFLFGIPVELSDTGYATLDEALEFRIAYHQKWGFYPETLKITPKLFRHLANYSANMKTNMG